MNGAIFKNGVLLRSSGIELLSARLANRIKLYIGEWFLEPAEGIDWWNLRGIAPDLDAIKRVVKNALARDEEVISVYSVSVVMIDSSAKAKEYDRPLRTGIITARVNTVYGEIEVSI